jgi:hypothetical protein
MRSYSATVSTPKNVFHHSAILQTISYRLSLCSNVYVNLHLRDCLIHHICQRLFPGLSFELIPVESMTNRLLSKSVELLEILLGALCPSKSGLMNKHIVKHSEESVRQTNKHIVTLRLLLMLGLVWFGLVGFPLL